MDKIATQHRKAIHGLLPRDAVAFTGRSFWKRLSLTLMPHRSASPPAYSTCMGSLSLSESLSRGRRRGEEGEKAKDRMEERRGRRPGCARTRAAEQACGQRAGPGCTGMVKSGRTPGSPTLDDRRPASARSHDYKADLPAGGLPDVLAETGQRLIVLSDVIARRGQLERHRPQAEGGPSRDLLSARLSSHALDPPPADERAAGVVPFARRLRSPCPGSPWGHPGRSSAQS